MTPLLGTKTPSAPVGATPTGDRRAARSLLSCASWSGMGLLWRGMGGGRPPHRQHGLSCSPAVRYFFWSEPGPPTMVFTKHETRDTNHGLYAFHESQLPYPRFPTISHDFPAPPPPLRRSSVHAPSAFLGQPPGLPRRPVTAFLRVVARHGAAMARHGRHGAPRAAVRAPSAPATGPFGFSRITRPGYCQARRASRRATAFSRITAFKAVRFSVGARGVASPETAVRTTASAGKSLFSSSPLFTIVRHCSPKNIALRQCPRAARSLLSCALWRGMGRLWRGMGRPEPLHHPHQQHGPFGFSRITRPGYCQARGKCQREFRGFHEITAFSRITAFSSNAAAVGW